MTITYKLYEALYINLTNKCPCDCIFCIRNKNEHRDSNESLWLEREPSLEEVISALDQEDYKQYKEVVFCGYGEPTERLDVLLEAARFLKKKQALPVRLNTNGLSDLINGKKTAILLAECIDHISISLNAPDAATYNALCLPSFGEGAYEALIQFTKDCKQLISRVTLSVVAGTMDEEKLQKCRVLCASMDIPLRERQ